MALNFLPFYFRESSIRTSCGVENLSGLSYSLLVSRGCMPHLALGGLFSSCYLPASNMTKRFFSVRSSPLQRNDHNLLHQQPLTNSTQTTTSDSSAMADPALVASPELSPAGPATCTSCLLPSLLPSSDQPFSSLWLIQWQSWKWWWKVTRSWLFCHTNDTAVLLTFCKHLENFVEHTQP